MQDEWHSYHCVCSQLLLASLTPLPSLPQRRLDKATILPLSAVPAKLSSSDGARHAAALQAPIADYTFSPTNAADPSSAPNGSSPAAPSSLDAELVVALDDGLEKRTLLRCVRCESVWAYLLDSQQFPGGGDGATDGPRGDVVYILDGAVVATGTMLKGRSKG